MIAVTLLWSACAHQGSTRRSYVGTVTRIEHPEGAYHSTALGQTPFTRIVVAIHAPYSRTSHVVKLTLNDAYVPAVYGQVGDRITFRSTAALPLNRELPFRAIVDYRVRPQRAIATTE